MNINLACADFTFPLLRHDKSLDLIALLDFDGVDIGLFDGRSHLWPSREFVSVGRSARELKRKLSARGLTAADVFLQMSPDFASYAINHPLAARRRKARTWFQKTLEYAAGCGSRHVTCLPGACFDTEARSVSLKRSCDELAWRVEQARDHGLSFGVEAHTGSIVPTPREAERLVKSVPGLTLTLDYTHFCRKGLPDSAAEPLLAYASHFHVRGARKGRLQASFTDNTIDYRRVVQVMKSIGYRGAIGIEYIWVDWEHCNQVDNISETTRLRDFIRSELRRSGGSHEK